MGIGDINSTAKGSGARYNDGKPDMSLIPLGIVSELGVQTGNKYPHITEMLYHVGRFQMGGEEDALYDALRALGTKWDDCARVFDYGKRKYAAWNWAKGMAWSIPLACIGRHALKIINDNEMLDNESNLPHTAHIECNIVMLLWYSREYPEGDDRFKLFNNTGD